MKELLGIILLTVLVVLGSRNSNTDVSLVGNISATIWCTPSKLR